MDLKNDELSPEAIIEIDNVEDAESQVALKSADQINLEAKSKKKKLNGLYNT